MAKVTIPIDLGGVQESKPVPAGRYSLTIASVEEAKSQKGLPQLVVQIGIDGHDDAPNLRHYVSLPSPGDEKGPMKALFLKRFLQAFKIPHSGMEFDTDDFPGARADLDLSLSEPDENGNVYNRLQLPKAVDDGVPAGGRKAPPPPKR